ncbi:MAG: T9SS type A sorting domain-containing protein, partial [Flavobacteriales bacterium]
IDGIEFDEWFDNNWDSVVVDEELLDEVEEWDITEWSDSLIDLVFGNDVDVDDDIDSDDTYVISDSLDQNEMDSLLGTGVVTFTNDDLDDMWEDFLEENDFDGTNTSFDDLLEQFGEYVEEKAQSALSITDISESSLSVYFNTNNSVLTIESEVVNQVSVFNINGQNVYNVNTKSNQIDLSSLNSGIYVLILDIEGKPYTQKIVK